MENINLSYAGHIMRNTSRHYDTLLRTIEGRREDKRGRGRSTRTWVDDLRDSVDWLKTIRPESGKESS